MLQCDGPAGEGGFKNQIFGHLLTPVCLGGGPNRICRTGWCHVFFAPAHENGEKEDRKSPGRAVFL